MVFNILAAAVYTLAAIYWLAIANLLAETGVYDRYNLAFDLDPSRYINLLTAVPEQWSDTDAAAEFWVKRKRPATPPLTDQAAAQFQGRSSSMRLILWSAIRASTSVSQARGSTPLSFAVSIRV